MKQLKYWLISSLAILLMVSCEYLESPDDTTNIQQGFITYPAVSLNGEQFVTIALGDNYEDAGATASLGSDDITTDIVVSGSVDTQNPGVYTINYEISVINALDEASVASQQRYVAVVTESAKGIDLAGTYNGDGTAVAGSWNQQSSVSNLGGAWYQIDKALASGNNLSIFFALVAGEGDATASKIIVPSQISPFGMVNTTESGTSANLNENGFEWNLYISCCGLFGPIIFSR